MACNNARHLSFLEQMFRERKQRYWGVALYQWLASESGTPNVSIE